jgi:hypothetical protein
MTKFNLIKKHLDNNKIKYIIKYETSFSIKINKNTSIFIFNRDSRSDQKYNLIIYKNRKNIYYATSNINKLMARLKLILNIYENKIKLYS